MTHRWLQLQDPKEGMFQALAQHPQPVSGGTRTRLRLCTHHPALKSQRAHFISVFNTTTPAGEQVSMRFEARRTWVPIPASPLLVV